ncbi:hypothetical protein A3SI_02978 [Nitritalea halalkaliphila LW7]|uniref:Outer membrane protein beta-barrel domain-containing protein n=1 Tax=Nitritalea halalkaliphila LW7 TaxID=1189621 RepID=I5C9I4_9BACT|nr:hypothetical protein [Nitritalea halalkaliphila]EIM78486.1 hypothetical protein A3SI_02978 [Nitritalea halalkaliphila LW7]
MYRFFAVLVFITCFFSQGALSAAHPGMPSQWNGPRQGFFLRPGVNVFSTRHQVLQRDPLRGHTAHGGFSPSLALAWQGESHQVAIGLLWERSQFSLPVGLGHSSSGAPLTAEMRLDQTRLLASLRYGYQLPLSLYRPLFLRVEAVAYPALFQGAIDGDAVRSGEVRDSAGGRVQLWPELSEDKVGLRAAMGLTISYQLQERQYLQLGIEQFFDVGSSVNQFIRYQAGDAAGVARISFKPDTVLISLKMGIAIGR